MGHGCGCPWDAPTGKTPTSKRLESLTTQQKTKTPRTKRLASENKGPANVEGFQIEVEAIAESLSC